MQRKNISESGSAAAAAPAATLARMEDLVQRNYNPEQLCLELCQLFQVQPTEVALLQVEDSRLKFLFPHELKTAGSIPLSSASSIAAHTALSKKVELYNNFARVKHATIFETVKLAAAEENVPPLNPPIQKLMSTPVLSAAGEVLGVIQICRKGLDLISSGPDFTTDDLHRLERAANLIGRAACMQKASEPPAK